jgi:hypothetical protein
MHDHGGRAGPARPPRRRWRPYLAALVAVLALALAVAGCGGSGGGDKGDGVASLDGGKATATTSPGNSGKDFKQRALAYARCLRQHGVDMPDPKFDAQGRMALQMPAGVGPDDPKFKAADQACQQYAPSGEPDKPDPQLQQQMVAYARCMRQHGINIADPKPGEGIGIDGSTGVNPEDPKYKAADQACQRYAPKGGSGRVDSGPQGPGGSR